MKMQCNDLIYSVQGQITMCDNFKFNQTKNEMCHEHDVGVMVTRESKSLQERVENSAHSSL